MTTGTASNTALTSGNKKSLTCPFCETELNWNTSDEYVQGGNHYIICSNCHQKFTIPIAELMPRKSTGLMSYTNDIYANNSTAVGKDAVHFTYDDDEQEWSCNYTYDELVENGAPIYGIIEVGTGKTIFDVHGGSAGNPFVFEAIDGYTSGTSISTMSINLSSEDAITTASGTSYTAGSPK